ncbi:hypothetical protein I7I51_01681 [Histoplasma capsulatum]|uniref:Uncharacterized protein n=1 Tax=Ajellomyces capsulatus TaxID=5037 RepID=A0A8A1MJ66_AJECA|nr:hypothetical protein I7I51_01681 [Histoplasma capsulatum]
MTKYWGFCWAWVTRTRTRNHCRLATIINRDTTPLCLLQSVGETLRLFNFYWTNEDSIPRVLIAVAAHITNYQENGKEITGKRNTNF